MPRLAGNALQQVVLLTPERAGTQALTQVVIDLPQVALQPGAMRLKPRAHCRHPRRPQPVRFRRAHRDDLTSALDQRRQRLGLLVRQGARRRPHGVAEMGQHLAIQPIGLGQAPGGTGEVADLPRGLPTATGKPATPSSATSGASYPPVASTTSSWGRKLCSQPTSSAIPAASWERCRCSPLGRTATSSAALATSIPTTTSADSFIRTPPLCSWITHASPALQDAGSA
jgi:hypothetical protein